MTPTPGAPAPNFRKLRKWGIWAGIIFAVIGIRHSADSSTKKTAFPIPPTFHDRHCRFAESAPIDMTRGVLPSEFPYALHEGCFARLDMPNSASQYWQDAVDKNPKGWISVRCVAGGKFVPPTPLDSPANLACPNGQAYYQGVGKILIQEK